MAYYETDAGARVFSAGVLDFPAGSLPAQGIRLLDNLWRDMLAVPSQSSGSVADPAADDRTMAAVYEVAAVPGDRDETDLRPRRRRIRPPGCGIQRQARARGRPPAAGGSAPRCRQTDRRVSTRRLTRSRVRGREAVRRRAVGSSSAAGVTRPAAAGSEVVRAVCPARRAPGPHRAAHARPRRVRRRDSGDVHWARDCPVVESVPSTSTSGPAVPRSCGSRGEPLQLQPLRLVERHVDPVRALPACPRLHERSSFCADRRVRLRARCAGTRPRGTAIVASSWPAATSRNTGRGPRLEQRAGERHPERAGEHRGGQDGCHHLRAERLRRSHRDHADQRALTSGPKNEDTASAVITAATGARARARRSAA